MRFRVVYKAPPQGYPAALFVLTVLIKKKKKKKKTCEISTPIPHWGHAGISSNPGIVTKEGAYHQVVTQDYLTTPGHFKSIITHLRQGICKDCFKGITLNIRVYYHVFCFIYWFPKGLKNWQTLTLSLDRVPTTRFSAKNTDSFRSNSKVTTA